MKIKFINGPKAGEEKLLVPPGISIGRETDNDVNLLIGGVSRYHSKISFLDGQWILKDLGSTNGTKLNGLLITEPTKIKNGDIITLGDQNIHVGEEQQQASIAKPEESQPKPVLFSPISDSVPTAEAPKPLFEPISLTPIPEPVPSAITPKPENSTQYGEASNTAETINDMINKEKHSSNLKDFFTSEKNKLTTGTKGAVNEAHNILGKVNLFGKKGHDDKNKNNESDADGNKKRVSNLLFYTLVIGGAIICISVFMMAQQMKEKKPAATQTQKSAGMPLLVSYSKQITTPDNVFRFSMHIENGSVSFALDDIKSQRHYSKTIKEPEKSTIESLEEKIKSTNFMTLQQESPGVSNDGTDANKRLTIAYGNNLKDISVRNTFSPSSFEDIEHAIDDFAELHGLRTISLTPEEMKQEADKAFTKAEQLFLNYEAKPENLRECIARYAITVEMLSQFVPKPEKWDVARKRQQEAQGILEKKVKDLKFDFDRSMQLKDYPEARNIASKMMQMVSPDSKAYQNARQYKLNLDKIIGEKPKK